MNIFELLATMAAAIRSLDSRINYAPVHIEDSGGASLHIQVTSDEAVHDLAKRFDMPPPREHRLTKKDGAGSQWLATGTYQGSLSISVAGPHHQFTSEGALTSREGD
jgi:hypothetical protein